MISHSLVAEWYLCNSLAVAWILQPNKPNKRTNELMTENGLVKEAKRLVVGGANK